MNRKYSLGVKVAAIILSVLTLAITIGSVIGVAVIADAGLYTTSLAAVQKERVYYILQNRCLNAAYRYAQSDAEGTRQFFEYTNFYFRLSDEKGDVLIDTYEETFGDPAPEPWLTYTEDYVILAHPTEPDFWYAVHAWEYDDTTQSASAQKVTVTGYISSSMLHTDDISITLYWLRVGYDWRFLLPILGFLALLANIILYIFLLCAAGHHPGITEAIPNVFDKIPLDIHAVALFFLAIFAMEVYPYHDAEWSVICLVLYAVLGYLLLLQFTMSFATRVKIGTVFRGTLIWKICALIFRILRAIGRAILSAVSHLPILIGTVILLAVGILWSFLCMAFIATYDGFGIFLWIVGWGCIAIGAIYLTICLHKLKKGAERIAAGELNHEIETKYLIGPFRQHARTLNHISDGMSHAVEERLKSERFRTELITNVSHDLKTPLTSIVSYIDLMKKENIEDPTVCEYIEVLDRQSARLKKLTEDLVEASKASTGNLEVSPTPCDLGELLSQCAGEYTEKLLKNELTLIVHRPEHPVMVYADGRHLWRIFDNLMNNICKYAQPGTRVYLNLEEVKGKAILIFRNTSRYALNVTGDELMERFVRGDSSRHTEGSGLGLSIARSLTELQNGTMGIYVDGDLFKVVLSFGLMDGTSPTGALND